MICLCGNGNVVPVAWQSLKISRVKKSPLTSEVFVQNEEADAGYLLVT